MKPITFGSLDQYYAEMWNNPLRNETSVLIKLAGYKSVKHGTPSFEFEIRKNLIKDCDQLSEMDPISRRPPRQTFQFSVIDFNREIFEKYDWSEYFVIVKLRYSQQVGPRRGYGVAIAPYEYYVTGVSESKGITRFSCESGEKKLREFDFYGTSNLLSTDPTLFWSFLNTDCRASTGFSLQGIAFGGMVGDPTPEILPELPNYIKECKGSEALQIFMNAQGRYYLFDSFPYFPSSDPASDNLNIRFKNFAFNFADSVAKSQSYKLYQRDVIDKSITHSKSPKIRTLSAELQQGIDTYGKLDSTLKIKAENDIMYVRHKPGFVQFTPSTPSGIELDRRAEIAILKFSPENIGDTYKLELYENPTSKITSERKINADGTDDILKNPCMLWSTVDTIANYYSLRHNLKLEFRGDPTLEPGDSLSFEYEPGLFVPCLVLSNRTKFNGTIRGELILKVLVRSDENNGGGDSGGGEEPIPPEE